MIGWQPDGELALDPAVAIEQAAKQLPARWAVYLMSDADDRPVQLLCVKNLRASVKRRLSESAEGLASKRVDYRVLVRTIRWRRVGSTLESDLAFLDIARQVFPDSYRKIVTIRPAWWLHVNPTVPFPRWTRTDDPTTEGGVLLGPLAEKQQAQRLIELIEDTFDLCRYHNILVQSPCGSPCAYKDMGKCPAPCDGSVSMQQYRALIDWSLRTLIDPSEEIEDQTQRMRDAAGELRFELAGKIKQFVEAMQALRRGDYRFVRPIEQFRYLAIQPGPMKGRTRLVDCTPAGTTEMLGLIAEPTHELAYDVETRLASNVASPIDPERLAILTHHVMGSRSAGDGIYLPIDQITTAALTKAYRQVSKQVTEAAADGEGGDDEGDDEGIVREAINV